MGHRITVKEDELKEGYYVVFGSSLGSVGFIRIHNGNVWGLSRWRGSIAYRTLGKKLEKWLENQPPSVQFRHDIDRKGWKQ